MVEVENKKVVKVYLGKSTKPRYFVGQLVPSMIKINDQKFLLCDGSPHVWTDKQKELLHTNITNADFAPDMSGKTTGGLSTPKDIGITKNSTIPLHTHNVTPGQNSAYEDSYLSNKLSIKDSEDTFLGESYQGTDIEGTSALNSNPCGDDTGITTSKRTYVYWYLYIGDE